MSTMQAGDPVYALLTDGSTVEIRLAGPADYEAVKAMHEAMAPENIYLRFFSMSHIAAEQQARRICREPSPGDMSLLAFAGEELVGVGTFCPLPEDPARAEVAFAVADHMHHKGIATLLLEHLVSRARRQGVTALSAQTLVENADMLRVFSDAGLAVRRKTVGDTLDMTFPLPVAGTGLDSYLDAVGARERSADIASLRHLLAPASVAVIGASRRAGTVGRAILDNIRTAGYAGRLYPVNPHATEVGGLPCLPSPDELPEAVDLAVIAVPPAAVVNAAEGCGRRGVGALVVITAGLDAAASADLLSVCRRRGMRLVGPNCFGVAVPALGLDATFADGHARPGAAGLVMQSGGLGFAVVNQLSRLGIGISSFVSAGNKLDVSSNDMLLWWEADTATRLAVLYIESFGNPRKFARTARRVAVKMPVLTVQAGRSVAGQRAAASHTAAVATPLVSRETLFEQAGIIATPTLGELIEATALLASQPVPDGRTVAIVSNVGGAGVLAADVCADLGLTVHRPHGATRDSLRALVPDGGTVNGPVDTTATISAAAFQAVIEQAAADDEVNAVIALVLPTAATGDLPAAIQRAQVGVPVAAVHLDQAESVRLLPGASAPVPFYGYPEAAVTAMARAARYGAWRAAPRGVLPAFSDIKADDARTLLREFLRGGRGGWLPAGTTAGLLRCYGIPLIQSTAARSEDEAVRAFQAAAGPVVLKADVPGLVHKTDAGGVELDIRDEAGVRAAYQRLAGRFAGKLRQVLIQPMITGGTELIAGMLDDHVFGPLVVLGPGGVATEVLGGHVARLTPLTDVDADALIRSVKTAPLLLGYRGSPPADLGALRDLLLRLSRLADDLPEITDLDLNPVIARPDGVLAVDARIKAVPYREQDPFLRRLR